MATHSTRFHDAIQSPPPSGTHVSDAYAIRRRHLPSAVQSNRAAYCCCCCGASNGRQKFRAIELRSATSYDQWQLAVDKSCHTSCRSDDVWHGGPPPPSMLQLLLMLRRPGARERKGMSRRQEMMYRNLHQTMTARLWRTSSAKARAMALRRRIDNRVKTKGRQQIGDECFVPLSNTTSTSMTSTFRCDLRQSTSKCHHESCQARTFYMMSSIVCCWLLLNVWKSSTNCVPILQPSQRGIKHILRALLELQKRVRASTQHRCNYVCNDTKNKRNVTTLSTELQVAGEAFAS